MNVEGKHYRTVWAEGASHESPKIRMIDQTRLPFEFLIHDTLNVAETCFAISKMYVRGAGAIEGTAGFGMVQGVFTNNPDAARGAIEATRPTAKNLFYATREVYDAAARSSANSGQAARIRAEEIANANVASCEKIGDYGLTIVRSTMPRDQRRRQIRIMTQCNAGWLAMVDRGSATAPMYAAQEEGIDEEIIVNRTGPREQGQRLTAWELQQQGVKFFIIEDTMLSYYMEHDEVDLVIVGADRIAENGDVANKIGTQNVARLAFDFDIPFYVAAPTPTIDMSCLDGAAIEIELREAEEMFYKTGLTDDGRIERIRTVPIGIPQRKYPAFDVTGGRFVTGGIITEQGIISATREGVASLGLKVA